jgi:hypothetical protein
MSKKFFAFTPVQGNSMSVFLTTKAVTLRTGLTTDAIRWHEKHGRLLSIKVERSPGIFMRVFLADDVDHFVRVRADQAQTRKQQRLSADSPGMVLDVVPPDA